MNILKKMVFMTILLAVAGNSLASDSLSVNFGVPAYATFVATVWITPDFHGGPTPVICEAVTISPEIVEMNSISASTSTAVIEVELVALSLVSVDPVDLSPGKAAKIYIRNNGPELKSYALEFMVFPAVANDLCGAKASGQVFVGDFNGDGLVPVGSPVSMNGNFKAGKALKDVVN